MRPLVSIVITSYNYAAYLRQTIDSALQQTYAPLEVIVVDDGSTDVSPDIVRSYGERVRAIFKPNGGLTSSMNAGFAEARGDIVMFLDSDDALKPEAVAAAVAAWRPGVTAIQFRLATIDGEGRPLGGVLPNFRPGRTPEDVRREAMRSGLYTIASTSGNAYCRAFLKRLMPLCTETFRSGPDGPINAVAPLYGDVVTLDRTLGFYRIHGENTYAQQAIKPGSFAKYIAADERRVAYFRAHAAALGIALPENLLDRAFHHLQYRLASLRLRPEEHPVPGDSRLGLLRRAVGAAIVSQDSVAVRLCALLWMVCLAAAPHRTAQWLVALRFVGGQRPAALNAALKALRVTGAPNRATLAAAHGALSVVAVSMLGGALC